MDKKMKTTGGGRGILREKRSFMLRFREGTDVSPSTIVADAFTYELCPFTFVVDFLIPIVFAYVLPPIGLFRYGLCHLKSQGIGHFCLGCRMKIPPTA